MKKFVAMGALALALASVSEEQASAWVNCKFGVGLNWNWQSGGNNFLWGLYRNGQVPVPPGAQDPHYQPGYPYPMMYPGPGHAEMQPAPGTGPGPAPASVPTHLPPPASSGVFYPGYQLASYPPYYPYYYVPVNYSR